MNLNDQIDTLDSRFDQLIRTVCEVASAAQHTAATAAADKTAAQAAFEAAAEKHTQAAT